MSRRSQYPTYPQHHPHHGRPYIVVHDHDVLGGRGVNIAQHPGNERFRALVNSRYDENYCTSYTTSEKRAVAEDIIKHIKSLDPPGRFLKRMGRSQSSRGLNGPWEELTERECIKKTCQALRDCNRPDREGYAAQVAVPDDVQENAKQRSESGMSLKEHAAAAAARAAATANTAAVAAATAAAPPIASPIQHQQEQQYHHQQQHHQQQQQQQHHHHHHHHLTPPNLTQPHIPPPGVGTTTYDMNHNKRPVPHYDFWNDSGRVSPSIENASGGAPGWYKRPRTDETLPGVSPASIQDNMLMHAAPAPLADNTNNHLPLLNHNSAAMGQYYPSPAAPTPGTGPPTANFHDPQAMATAAAVVANYSHGGLLSPGPDETDPSYDIEGSQVSPPELVHRHPSMEHFNNSPHDEDQIDIAADAVFSHNTSNLGNHHNFSLHLSADDINQDGASLGIADL